MLKPVSALAALLVASTLVISTVGKADPANSMRVSYADLNLASHAGQRILESRIARAATVVCIYDDGRDLDLKPEVSACRDAAVADAQPAYAAAVNAARHGTVTVLDAAALVVTAQ